MPGPAPKHPALRQRRNKTSTAASLPSVSESATNEVPDLYVRDPDWHPMVKEWWTGLWRSPMASEFLHSDKLGGLYLLADLQQIRWTATEPGDLLDAAKEIRLQEVRFGLSPTDRRRLQWTVAPDEDEPVATGRTAPKKRAKADPRGVLQVLP